MMGVASAYAFDDLTFRELWSMIQGRLYHDLMMASHVTAGVWNAQRTKASDRVWWFGDFHPDHIQEKRPTGRAVMRSVLNWFAPGDLEWAEGHSPEDI